MTVVKIQPFCTHHLVKSEDLNHHGTLFAGRSAEWFVEAGFIAAASLLNPKNIICLKIHGMMFTNPIKAGEVICYTSRIVYTGRSSLVAYITVTRPSAPESVIVDGFITFIHVNDNTCPTPHNLEIKPETRQELEWFEKARRLKE